MPDGSAFAETSLSFSFPLFTLCSKDTPSVGNAGYSEKVVS